MSEAVGAAAAGAAPTIRRGDIWETAPGVTVVVLQRDLLTAELATVVCAVVTTTPQPTGSPLRTRIGDAPAAWVKANLVVTVPRPTLTRRLGRLGATSMRAVEDAVAAVLGVDGPAAGRAGSRPDRGSGAL